MSSSAVFSVVAQIEDRLRLGLLEPLEQLVRHRQRTYITQLHPRPHPRFLSRMEVL